MELVAHACNPTYLGDRDQDGDSIHSGQTVLETSPRKYPAQKRAGRMVQVIEHQPTKHEALSSSPGTAKKKKRTD
jgi:hypothetical protein